MRILDSTVQQLDKPDDLQLETDLKNGVPYLVGRCTACREYMILKWTGAHMYKCQHCHKQFMVRRNR